MTVKWWETRTVRATLWGERRGDSKRSGGRWEARTASLTGGGALGEKDGSFDGCEDEVGAELGIPLGVVLGK